MIYDERKYIYYFNPIKEPPKNEQIKSKGQIYLSQLFTKPSQHELTNQIRPPKRIKLTLLDEDISSTFNYFYLTLTEKSGISGVPNDMALTNEICINYIENEKKNE